ncbi:abscisic acid 8'-hydroxylase 3-like [Zea mays]|uniref:(+)-abscisic acid 8'-hydroxylase n=1 Tax=Zea mays TaxID=4577 RepID=K7UTR6_MAIZE|nr:abscisic acid 8'-hydroxylase 3-like [Zea mays]AQK51799.1 abscisic acid 8'-hydroxylase3 [Zea mays]|eukprot:NP_001334144.1 abscisic acid 8'-hydroxylase 3-like [Zea mays]
MAFFLAVACIYIVSLTLLVLLLDASRRRRTTGGGSSSTEEHKLPPGSLGLPFLGETLQLYSQNPKVFFASRLKRYGEVFKTHVLGCPCVILASPEAARMVLVSQAHLFKPTYPPSKERMIGAQALFFHQGDYHLRLRRLVKGWLGPDALRGLVPDVEAAVASTLDGWEGRVTSTFHTMKRLTFDVGVIAIFGHRLAGHVKEELRRNYFTMEKGYNSFPIPVACTSYSQAIKARQRLGAVLSGILAERRARRSDDDDDHGLLNALMRSRDDSGAAPPLSDDQIADNVIGVLFAAQDTTASVLTWILKFLHDNPKLLEAVKVEQMAAYEENDGGRLPLTWAQTRKMSITHLVILESLRLASIIAFTFREAVEDVHYQGFLIPKGWKVMPLFSNLHYSPDYFEDPHKFDPSRFKVAPRPGTFLPFGSGVHACPGNDLAKLEMLVLIHRLVTTYRWEVVGSSDDVTYSPFPVPKRGLLARLSRATTGSAVVGRAPPLDIGGPAGASYS